MTILLSIVGLTAVYMMTLGSTAWEDIVAGIGMSTVLLWVYRKVTVTRYSPPPGQVLRNLTQLPRFAAFVSWDIALGTWQVASYVVGLKKLEHPGIVKIPFDDESQVRLSLALWALTLSPGSFVVDVNLEERFILAHFIDISDPDRLKADIHRKYLHVSDTHTSHGPDGEDVPRA